MNNVVLMGRLTREPDVRYTQGAEPLAIARYTLAVDRRRHKENEQNADFIRCVAFGRGAEFAQNYLHQGTKIVIQGHIQTGSYQDNNGNTVYTTDVIVDSQEFAESRRAQEAAVADAKAQPASNVGDEDFMMIPDGIDDELPFN